MGLGERGGDKTMSVTLRETREGDAPELGRICHDAFRVIAEQHAFPPDFPNVEVAQGVIASMIGASGIHGVAAEADGRLIGSNFLDERGPIAGLGPITVDPGVQNAGVGARLMTAVMDHGREHGAAGIRLVQSGYHTRSLSLYLKLGFEVREHLSCLQGPAIGQSIPGCAVRPAGQADVEACDRLCHQVHGHARHAELEAAVAGGSARVVERAGRITAYATSIAFFGHAVAETNDDLEALIGAAPAYLGPGFLVPTRNGDFMRWCLARGLRVTQSMTLMSLGLYNDPTGAWLPSVLY
jgi:GNAT superfamily N-acetyltransferase